MMTKGIVTHKTIFGRREGSSCAANRNNNHPDNDNNNIGFRVASSVGIFYPAIVNPPETERTWPVM